MKFREIMVLFLLCFCAGIAGGLISRVFVPQDVAAKTFSPTITTNQMILLGNQKIIGRWYGQRESSGIFLFDSFDRSRLELNLFPDGRPVMALNDERHLCKFLFKLEWAPNIPMMFFKEPADRNRLIMALNLKNYDDPFLVLFDEIGLPQPVFGTFEMP